MRWTGGPPAELIGSWPCFLLEGALLWGALVWPTADPRRLPSQLRVADVPWTEKELGRLWRHLAATLLRVAPAFGITMVVATAPGLLLGVHPWPDLRVDSWAA